MPPSPVSAPSCNLVQKVEKQKKKKKITLPNAPPPLRRLSGVSLSNLIFNDFFNVFRLKNIFGLFCAPSIGAPGGIAPLPPPLILNLKFKKMILVHREKKFVSSLSAKKRREVCFGAEVVEPF